MFEVLPLSSLVEKQQGGGTPPRNNSAFWHGDIPWASVKDFKDDQLELQATEETISNLGLNSSTSNLIPPGTPMVCTRMAVGRCAVSLTPTAINQDVRALYPQKEVNPRYLLRLVASLQGKADSLSVGSTVKGIRSSDFLAIKAHIAPKNEQGAIANILDTLDTQIEKTEALIAKLEKVKKGLLHDLLTRGIDENDQLRPSPEQAQELYKESPLGLIPKEWACVSIGEIARSTTLGTANRGAESSAKTKLIKMGNLNWGNTLSLTDVENISDRKVHENLFLNDADLLFNTRNTPELVGKTCSWKGGGSSFTFDNNILRIRFSEGLNGHFIASYMSGDIGKGRIGRLATGTTSVAAIYWRSLSRLEVPVPSPREQQLIVEKIKSSQNNTNTLNDDLTSLKRLKAGLMDDLLTGHVRTTSLLEQFKEATSA